MDYLGTSTSGLLLQTFLRSVVQERLQDFG